MVIKCRRKCRTEMDDGFSPLYRENIEDLHFYEKKVKETLCLLECNQEYRDLAGKRALQRLPKKTEYKIMTQQHYEYLHGCYYQVSLPIHYILHKLYKIEINFCKQYKTNKSFVSYTSNKPIRPTPFETAFRRIDIYIYTEPFAISVIR